MKAVSKALLVLNTTPHYAIGLKVTIYREREISVAFLFGFSGRVPPRV